MRSRGGGKRRGSKRQNLSRGGRKMPLHQSFYLFLVLLPACITAIDSHTSTYHSVKDTRQLQQAFLAPLSEASCNTVGEQFLCDIPMILQEPNATKPPTTVEAVLTCPLKPEVGPNLTATDHRTCGCNAVLTTLGNSTGQIPKQCSCHYCPTNKGQAPPLAIDCSKNEPDPFVQGTCKAIACDGSCLDSLPPLDPTTMPPDSNATTPAPNTTTPAPNATTMANSTQSPTVPETQAPIQNASEPTEPSNETEAPTIPASGPTTEPVATATPTEASPIQQNYNSSDARGFPWWVPSSFVVSTSEPNPTDEQWMILQQYYWQIAEGVVAKKNPKPPQDITTENSNSSRYLRQQQLPPQRRQLTVVLSPGAAEIYQAEESDCPPRDIVPVNSLCYRVYARYLLVVAPEENKEKLANDYSTATQEALSKLARQPVPDSPFTMAGESQFLTPNLAAGECNLCRNSDVNYNPDKAFPGHPDFTCQDLDKLYNARSPQQCYNYDSQIEWSERSLFDLAQDWPLHYRDYCECSSQFSWTSNATRCSRFCPDNKRVPPFNVDVVVDLDNGLTCGQLETYGLFVLAVPDRCLAVARHGAICCTEEIVEETPEPEPTSPPAWPGTTIVQVNNSFLVYSPVLKLTADVIMLSPEIQGLSRAYAALVKQVVAELGADSTSDADYATEMNSSSAASLNNSTDEAPVDANDDADTATNARRNLRSRALTFIVHTTQRRRLSVTFDATSAVVFNVSDTKCPSTVTFNSTCGIAYGRYYLRIRDEDEPAAIADEYSNYTQKAIDLGLLGTFLKEEDPQTSLFVDGATDDLVPPEPSHERTLSPKVIAYQGGYNTFFKLGLGLSITITVGILVASVCASDLSGLPHDDDSVDPWEKEHPKKNLPEKKHSSRGAKERAPSNKETVDPKTEKQEYLLYRDQVDALIQQKMPEEADNVDELLDLFYKRELILIATLQHMPDASEHPETEDQAVMQQSLMQQSTNSNFFDSFANWDGDSSDEFGEETHRNEDEGGGDRSRGGGGDGKEEDEDDSIGLDPIDVSARTIHEEDEDDMDESLRRDVHKEAEMEESREEADDSESSEESDVIPEPVEKTKAIPEPVEKTDVPVETGESAGSESSAEEDHDDVASSAGGAEEAGDGSDSDAEDWDEPDGPPEEWDDEKEGAK